MDEFRNPEQLRADLRRDSHSYQNATLGRGAVGATIGHLSTHLNGDQNRRRVIGWLFYEDLEGEIFEVHSALS